MPALILDSEKIESDAAYRDEMRHRCLTDHFFLGRLMGFGDFIERLHRPVANLYFPKNPNIPIQDQHPIKNRLHLDPRYTFKTTFGRIDSLQWILAFPEEISIANLSATQPLAAQICTKTAEFLYRQTGRGSTSLQLLFPELVVSKKPEADWDTPNRKMGELDHTLNFSSPQTQQSGWHPWIENPDDMADTKNSGIRASHEVRQGVIDTYNTNKYTLRPGGYRNVRGTRYHPFDLYGTMLETMDPAEWKTLIRCSLIVKDGTRLVMGDFPKEDEIELQFPELSNLTYHALRTAFYDHYESFMCQMQNDPQGGNVPTFDEKLYTSALIAPEKIPILGDNVMVWRLPYGGKPYMAKYAEGASARIANGRVFVTDAWQGTYTPTNLAKKIVDEAKRHEIDQIILEDIPGTQYMQNHIRNESHRRNHPLRIEWWPYEEDDNKRREKMRMLEPVMRAGKIWVSTGITKQTEVRRQFLFLGLVLENGIVDCISKIADEIPWTVLRSDMNEEELQLQKRRLEDAAFNMVFHHQGIEAINEDERRRAEAHVTAMEYTSYGMAPLPGGLDG